MRGRLTLLSALLLAAPPLGAPPLGAQESTPGISEELATHRAATLSDITYDLRFRIPEDPDDDVTGELTLSLDRRGSGPLVLDFADPSRVRAVRVQGRPAPHEAVSDHLVIPGEALPPGRASVTLEFIAGAGPLNRRDDFLYTLFVPDRAHEVFPSFDQPDLKARFRLRLTVPVG